MALCLRSGGILCSIRLYVSLRSCGKDIRVLSIASRSRHVSRLSSWHAAHLNLEVLLATFLLKRSQHKTYIPSGLLPISLRICLSTDGNDAHLANSGLCSS